MLTMKECKDGLNDSFDLEQINQIPRFNYRLLQYLKKETFYRNSMLSMLSSCEANRNKELAFVR